VTDRMSATVRKPAVAGAFYPASAGAIRSQIGDYLSRVEEEAPEGRIYGIVSPHAGYVYSGQVAAYSYKLLEGKPITKVIVISPSHVEYFPFASVFTGAGYETPLGTVPVDRAMAEKIVDGDLVKASPSGHLQEHLSRQEHALEVQIPFLQMVLGDFTIVPIVMGDQTWDICEALGRAIAPLLEDPGVVVVASSDLSHFHSYDEARKLDARFCNMLEKMDPRALLEGLRKDYEACGGGPVVAAMIAAKEAGADRCRILHAANSGDVTGDRSSVVGYASAVFYSSGEAKKREKNEASGKNDFTLGDNEKRYLLDLARYTIAKKLGIERKAPERLSTPILERKAGAFVTLKTGGALRGCIGYIEAIKPLRETIEEMALAAAFNDPRFPPLRREEFAGISIEISVLSPLHQVSDPDEIVVGRDGLVIERGFNRGLLLPQVATEYHWNREQFLAQTCRKAMLPAGAWKKPDTKIYAFSAVVFGEKEMDAGRK